MRKYNVWILFAVVCSTGFYAAHVASFRDYFKKASTHAHSRAHYAALQPYSHLRLQSSADGLSFIDIYSADHGWLPADSTARYGLRRFRLADLEYSSFASTNGSMADPDLVQYDGWSAALLQGPIPHDARFRETEFPRTPSIGGNNVESFGPAGRLPDQPSTLASVPAPEPATLTALSGLIAIAFGAVRIRPRRRQPKH